MPAPCYSDACMGLAWGLQMFGSQTINHATTAAQAGNRGAIGTLGANGREGDSPRIENLDTGILNWLSFTNQCNQVRTETQPHAVTFASG